MLTPLDPWPVQPYQRGAESAGATAYHLPAIPGGQLICFWLQSLAPRPAADEFMLDLRDNVGSYEYNGSFTNLLFAYCGGAPAPYRADLDALLSVPRKLVLAGDFAQGFRLFCRVSETQFYRAHRVSELRVYGRVWELEETKNPRGAGPDDSVLARYDFQDLTGGILRDVSGNGHHGTLIGNMPTAF